VLDHSVRTPGDPSNRTWMLGTTCHSISSAWTSPVNATSAWAGSIGPEELLAGSLRTSPTTAGRGAAMRAAGAGAFKSGAATRTRTIVPRDGAGGRAGGASATAAEKAAASVQGAMLARNWSIRPSGVLPAGWVNACPLAVAWQ